MMYPRLNADASLQSSSPENQIDAGRARVQPSKPEAEAPTEWTAKTRAQRRALRERIIYDHKLSPLRRRIGFAFCEELRPDGSFFTSESTIAKRLSCSAERVTVHLLRREMAAAHGTRMTLRW